MFGRPGPLSKEHWVIVVTGDRFYDSYDAVGKVLAKYPGDSWVIHGFASGADSIADWEGTKLGMLMIRVPYWKRYHRAGGPIRNQAMVEIAQGLQKVGHRVVVLAFHDNIAESKGTKDMVKRCKRRGLEVKLYARKRKDVS